MKILAISNYVGDASLKLDAAVHLWRIKRPMLELAKHVDWTIDFQPAVVRDFHGYELNPDGFIKEYGDEEVAHLGQYDVIFTSYFTSPHIYTLLWAAEKEYGTKVIIDFDDDLFDVDPSNFAFWRSAGWQGHEFLGIIARVSKRLCTTNKLLANKLRNRSEVDPTIAIIPNYIADMYPDQTVDNGDKVVIGFFGGASHYNDLHESHVLDAVQKLMHKYKNVHFKVCGQPINKYLPKTRIHNVEVGQGVNWPTKVLPSMNLDIAVAPLLDTEFNKYKSNIKWQESTRMGSAFVGSNVGPYKSLKSSVATLVNNTTDEWYDALERLILDANARKAQVKRAKDELKKQRLENNWHEYKEMFEEAVYGKTK